MNQKNRNETLELLNTIARAPIQEGQNRRIEVPDANFGKFSVTETVMLGGVFNLTIRWEEIRLEVRPLGWETLPPEHTDKNLVNIKTLAFIPTQDQITVNKEGLSIAQLQLGLQTAITRYK